MGKNKIFIAFAVVAFVIFFSTAGAVDFSRPERPEAPDSPERNISGRIVQIDNTVRFRTDEIIVKFKAGEKFQRIRVSDATNIDEIINSYRKRADVVYAEPNYLAQAFFVPNDPYYSYQWNFDNPVYGGIHTEQAWDVADGSGVTVAVIDTGVAYENYSQSWLARYYLAPDLAQTSFAPGYDFVNKDTHPNDDNGHGTHVAGTISQSTNNGLGAAGVAYKARVMPVKVLDKNGSGAYADVADGIYWAVDHGANVINLSLGGSASASYLEEAAAYAYNHGVTVVAAAGNNGSGKVSYPAAYDNYVIAVGATRYDETKAYYSNYGSALDLMAPGGDLNVDQNSDGYGDGILQQTFGRTTNSWGYYFYQGTSMAAPHVAGVAALVISKGAVSSPDAVRGILQTTADDLGATGRDDVYGYGLVNAFAALAAVPLPSPTPTPTPTPAPTPTPTPTPSPTPSPSPSPTPEPEIIVFYDSFESGLNNWTQDSQNDWFQSSQRAAEGNYSAEVDGRADDSQLISQAINLQGMTNVAVSFSWYIERGLDAGEYLAFDVSLDGGNNWTEKARLRGNVDPEDAWQNVKVELNGISQMKMRFRGRMSSSTEDADVDAVKITAW